MFLPSLPSSPYRSARAAMASASAALAAREEHSEPRVAALRHQMASATEEAARAERAERQVAGALETIRDRLTVNSRERERLAAGAAEVHGALQEADAQCKQVHVCVLGEGEKTERVEGGQWLEAQVVMVVLMV